MCASTFICVHPAITPQGTTLIIAFGAFRLGERLGITNDSLFFFGWGNPVLRVLGFQLASEWVPFR